MVVDIRDTYSEVVTHPSTTYTFNIIPLVYKDRFGERFISDGDILKYRIPDKNILKNIFVNIEEPSDSDIKLTINTDTYNINLVNKGFKVIPVNKLLNSIVLSIEFKGSFTGEFSVFLDTVDLETKGI